MTLETSQTTRGPGSFKINNSILHEEEYIQRIRNAIKQIATINKDANPITLWEIIKGTIRNIYIKYSSEKKKQTYKNKNLPIK